MKTLIDNQLKRTNSKTRLLSPKSISVTCAGGSSSNNKYKIKIRHITEDPHQYDAFVNDKIVEDSTSDTYGQAHYKAKKYIKYLKEKENEQRIKDKWHKEQEDFLQVNKMQGGHSVTS